MGIWLLPLLWFVGGMYGIACAKCVTKLSRSGLLVNRVKSLLVSHPFDNQIVRAPLSNQPKLLHRLRKILVLMIGSA